MATLTVINTNDSGKGSLREAIALANDKDTIVFSSKLANKTIRLEKQLVIDKSLTIDGSDAPNLTLSGEGKTRILQISYDYSDVVLQDLTFANGSAVDNAPNTTRPGGAIEVIDSNTLVVENSKFINNEGERGGAIFVGYGASAIIKDSVFDGNDGSSANDGFSAGAISTYGGGEGAKVVDSNGERNVGGDASLDISGTTFTNNKGTHGAVYTLLTNLKVEDSVFKGNEGTNGSGAIFTDGANGTEKPDNLGGTTVIRNVVAKDNIGGGDYGGAFFLSGYSGDKYIIENTEITNNTASKGAGLAVQSYQDEANPVTLTIRDSTITNNTATSQGGGLWTDVKGGVTIEGSTFSGNRIQNANDSGIGGAVVLNTGKNVKSTITDTTFIDNYAGDQAGSIWISGKNQAENLTISDSQFAGNRSNGKKTENTVNFEVINGGGNVVQNVNGADAGIPGAKFVEDLSSSPASPAEPKAPAPEPEPEPVAKVPEKPNPEPEPEPVAKVPEKPEPEPELEPVARTPDKPEPKPEPEPTAKRPDKQEPEPEPIARTPEKPELEPEPEPIVKTPDKPESEPVAKVPEKSNPKPEPEPTERTPDKPKPDSESISEPIAKPSTPKPTPKPVAEPPEPEPTARTPDPEPISEPVSKPITETPESEKSTPPIPKITSEPVGAVPEPAVFSPTPAGLEPEPAVSPPVSEPETDISPVLSSGSDGQSMAISLGLVQGSTDSVNELLVVVVDDSQGVINGIAPNEAGYGQALLDEAVVVFSTLKTGQLSGLEISRNLALPDNARLQFAVIKNGSLDSLRQNGIGDLRLAYASDDRQPVAAAILQEPGRQLNLKVAAPDGSAGVTSVVLESLEGTPLIGSELQGYGNDSELIDLRGETGTRTATFDVYRNAGYNNLVGFYAIENEQGQIFDDFGNLLNPSDNGYGEAALANRLTNVNLTGTNGQLESFTTDVKMGQLLASFIVVDGTLEQLADSNIMNDPDIYFTHMGANSDGVDHIRLLGDNTFGFEDLSGGGDLDYNDMVVKTTIV
ncbi:MAG: DUF4114 domain-containing protein [Cyanobacteria bacterium P01_A01_bin.137]